MCLKYVFSFFLFWIFFGSGDGWRAVPANQAMYALRSSGTAQKDEIPDDMLPRTLLHSTYKFGVCGRGMISNVFLKTTLNLTFDSPADSQANYLYILADMSTQRYKMQCIVMKTYVAKKFQFWKSRMPLYYCHGQIFLMMLNTIQRVAIHEFYTQVKINMPANLLFEFYHPDRY